MIWHLKSVSVIRKHDAAWRRKQVKEGQQETLTAQVKTEGDSQAIKAVLRQLKASLREPDWRHWLNEHEGKASVKALALEIDYGEQAMHPDQEVCRVETEREHFAKANAEMEELYQMLTDDTAANDNKMAAIMEQKISIQEHFQPKMNRTNVFLFLTPMGNQSTKMSFQVK